MRFTFLLASSALAAGLTLAACSGTSQSIPGGSQSVAPMAKHAPHFTAVGPKGDAASCPSSLYFTCVDLSKGKSTLEICISTSGNCTSGLVGEWNFTSKIVQVKNGKKTKKIKATFDPNPGNPVTITYKTKKVKDSGGKIVYAQQINACEVTYPSSCIAGTIGISTSK